MSQEELPTSELIPVKDEPARRPRTTKPAVTTVPIVIRDRACASTPEYVSSEEELLGEGDGFSDDSTSDSGEFVPPVLERQDSIEPSQKAPMRRNSSVFTSSKPYVRPGGSALKRARYTCFNMLILHRGPSDTIVV